MWNAIWTSLVAAGDSHLYELILRIDIRSGASSGASYATITIGDPRGIGIFHHFWRFRVNQQLPWCQDGWPPRGFSVKWLQGDPVVGGSAFAGSGPPQAKVQPATPAIVQPVAPPIPMPVQLMPFADIPIAALDIPEDHEPSAPPPYWDDGSPKVEPVFTEVEVVQPVTAWADLTEEPEIEQPAQSEAVLFLTLVHPVGPPAGSSDEPQPESESGMDALG